MSEEFIESTKIQKSSADYMQNNPNEPVNFYILAYQAKDHSESLQQKQTAILTPLPSPIEWLVTVGLTNTLCYVAFLPETP